MYLNIMYDENIIMKLFVMYSFRMLFEFKIRLIGLLYLLIDFVSLYNIENFVNINIELKFIKSSLVVYINERVLFVY